MALKKAVDLENGGTAEYWRVAPSYTFNVVTGELLTHVNLYVNETARRADKPDIHPDRDAPSPVTLAGAPALAAVQAGDHRAAVYEMLKGLPYFKGAQDV
jgi:hypothetical protein